MLRTSESETEILLGNKQLLGIFFVVAALLGIAFYGGYMVGRAGPGKKAVAPASTATEETASTPNRSTAGGETHSFPTDTSTAAGQNSSPAPTDAAAESSQESGQPPLGSPKRKQAEKAPNPQSAAAVAETSGEFTPQSGEQFLQVAAVGKDEAEAVADVLHKKGFRAHAVPKPGNIKIYRVLIGPIQDAADLSSTRDALRRTGFREVITQKY